MLSFTSGLKPPSRTIKMIRTLERTAAQRYATRRNGWSGC